MTDDLTHHIFDVIDRLGELEGDALLDQFTEENVSALRAAARLLRDGMDLDRYPSRNDFIRIVGALVECKRLWSAKLGETLTRAGKAFEMGEREQAVWILEGFIRFCPSPYYREVAERVLDRYTES